MGGLAAGQGMSAGMGSFWSGVEAQGNARSAVSSLVMRSTKSKQSPRTTVSSKTSRPSGIVQKPSHQVLVLNASYEPLSVISAPRALALLWDGKASTVVDRAQWISAGGQAIDVPSVVSLRRYVKVSQRTPPLNRRTILMRDEGKCQYCGKTAENIDHVIPRSRGGGTTWENCVAACKHCNSRKAAHYLKDMPGMKLRRKPGPPTSLCWVHAAVWKVSPDWKPYVGNISWEEIEARINAKMGKKSGKRKTKSGKGGNKGKKPPSPPPAADCREEGEAESVIAAYTGGAQ